MFGKHSVGGRPFLYLQSLSASLIDGDKIRVVPRAKFVSEWGGYPVIGLHGSGISGFWMSGVMALQFCTINSG